MTRLNALGTRCDPDKRDLSPSRCCLQHLSNCGVSISYTALVSMTFSMVEKTMRLQKGETRAGLQRAAIIERLHQLLKSAFWGLTTSG